MTEWDQWVTNYRQWMLDNDLPRSLMPSVSWVIAHFYIETTREIFNADGQLKGLKIELYMGDYAL